MNSLCRICRAPKAQAGKHCHSASYPRAESAPRTSPIPRRASEGEFSRTMNRGRRSRTDRATSRHPASPESIPRRGPAREMSWQGNPAAMRSTRSTPGSGNSLASRYRLASGKCASRVCRQSGSRSTCQRHSSPARTKPRSKPPIPAKSDPNVSGRRPSLKIGPLSSRSPGIAALDHAVPSLRIRAFPGRRGDCSWRSPCNRIPSRARRR